MEKLRLFSLYLYLFGLSIENWSPWGDETSLFRPALIFGMLYVILSFRRFSVNFSLKNIKSLLYPILILWLLLNLISLISSSIYLIDFKLNFTLLSCIVSFWILFNDLNRYTFLHSHFLYVVLLNGIFLSILSYFQIGVDIGYMERQSLLGNNSNIIGLSSLISVIITLYFVIENPNNSNKKRFILLLFIPFLLQTIAKTGSKGAIITLGISVIFYFITLNKPLKQKMPLIFLGFIGFLYGYFFMLKIDVLAERMSDFIETGDNTGRSIRWAFAVQIFLDNPFFGVGENGLNYLSKSFFDTYDPHNVYLYVLASGGILTFVPLILFLYRSFKNINRFKYFWNTNVYLILYLIMILFWFKAGGGLNSKLVWAYFALVSFTPLNYNKFKANEISNTRN